jgi:shikimate dehydrogenase
MTAAMKETMTKISARTQVCAVIGDPVGHSLSPQIHNAAFAALGLDFAYVAFHVKRGTAAAAMAGVRALGLRGLSVTIPHKVEIIPHLDEVDPVARAIGSVNTVVNDGGVLKGSSTDGPGALRALAAAGVDPAGRRVLLLGSGGAARALAFTLATLSPLPTLRILGVDRAELGKLTGDLAGKTKLPLKSAELQEATLAPAMAEAEIVIHATPIGMAPKADESLVPKKLIRPGQVVFDVVYTPLETRLLADAAAAGARVVPGLGMFVHQAAIQFELWTGQEAPVDLMARTVTGALSGSR